MVPYQARTHLEWDLERSYDEGMVKILRRGLIILLVGMLVVRSGMLVIRIVREWQQPVSRWQPANSDEQMIWENYQRVGK